MDLRQQYPFSWKEEDPRRRKNFTLGLHAEISVHVVPKKKRFEEEPQNQKCNSGPSALFTRLVLITTFQQNYHNNQLVVTPNKTISLYCHD